MASNAAPALSAVTLLPYQQRAVERRARFTWNNWSRQVGKSFAFSLRRILRGMERHRNQIFLSAGERQSRELMQCSAHNSVAALRRSVTGERWDGQSPPGHGPGVSSYIVQALRLCCTRSFVEA